MYVSHRCVESVSSHWFCNRRIPYIFIKAPIHSPSWHCAVSWNQSNRNKNLNFFFCCCESVISFWTGISNAFIDYQFTVTPSLKKRLNKPLGVWGSLYVSTVSSLQTNVSALSLGRCPYFHLRFVFLSAKFFFLSWRGWRIPQCNSDSWPSSWRFSDWNSSWHFTLILSDPDLSFSLVWNRVKMKWI